MYLFYFFFIGLHESDFVRDTLYDHKINYSYKSLVFITIYLNKRKDFNTPSKFNISVLGLTRPFSICGRSAAILNARKVFFARPFIHPNIKNTNLNILYRLICHLKTACHKK